MRLYDLHLIDNPPQITLYIFIFEIKVKRILAVPFDLVSAFGIAPHRTRVCLTEQMGVFPGNNLISAMGDWTGMSQQISALV